MKLLSNSMNSLATLMIALHTPNTSDALQNHWSQIGKNVGAGTDNWYESGFHVSVSGDGDTVAVGSPLVNETKGHVVVSRLNFTSGFWEQLGSFIVYDDEEVVCAAGFAVSLSHDGNILAVGFPGGTEAYSPNQRKRNFAMVYKWNPSTDWEPLGSRIFQNEMFHNGSGLFYHQSAAGWSVSLSDDGKSVAVGAPSYYNQGLNSTGQARVFRFNNASGDWDQLGQEITGVGRNYTGYSVSLSGDGTALAVGEPTLSYSSGTMPGGGSVQVWKLNATDGWDPLGSAIVGQSGDQVGHSVALSFGGESLAVGAPGYGPLFGSGLVRVYKFNPISGWLQFGSDILTDTESEYCWGGGCFGDGRSVDLSADGGTVAIGASGQVINDVIYGLARVFRHNGTDWEKIGETIPGERRFQDDSHVGYISLSSDGNRVVVGSPLHCTAYSDNEDCEGGYQANEYKNWTGHVRVFEMVEVTQTPTLPPSVVPTFRPTASPSKAPTVRPSRTEAPTVSPSVVPTFRSTTSPSKSPTVRPSQTEAPTVAPNPGSGVQSQSPSLRPMSSNVNQDTPTSGVIEYSYCLRIVTMGLAAAATAALSV